MRFTSLFALSLITLTTACALGDGMGGDVVGTGKIKAVGKDSFIAEDSTEIYFVNEVDPSVVKKLRKGQSVRMIDKHRKDDKGVEAILLEDGTHIAIGDN